MVDRACGGPARAGRPLVRTLLAGVGLGLALARPLAAQAPPAAAPERPQSYQADRALCVSGLSHQEREACLREAGAARQAGRRGQLEDDDATYRRNALRRCDPLPPPQRQDCITRMRDRDTTIEGSVEEGGIYREHREFVPPSPMPAAPEAGSRAR